MAAATTGNPGTQLDLGQAQGHLSWRAVKAAAITSRDQTVPAGRAQPFTVQDLVTPQLHHPPNPG